MHALVSRPVTDSPDRLAVATFLAILVHCIIILGVSFAPHERPDELRNSLDVVLVQSRTQEAPEDPDFLGQANQRGGGESEKVERPATPLPAPLFSRRAEIVAAARPRRPTTPLATNQRPRAAPEPRPDDPAPRRATPRALLAQTRAPARHKVRTRPTPTPDPKARSLAKPDTVVEARIEERAPERTVQAETPAEHAAVEPSTPDPPQPTRTLDAATLVSRSLAMASLSAEIDRKLDAYAKRPRRHWISASTREHKYASYMEAWRIKVERIGNLNYPDEARRRRLSGDLLLDVALNPDGTINDIILRRSSGRKVLDDAAVRIVKLAAPYAKFPRAIAEEVDILHIQRTWRFTSSNRFFGD